MSSLKASNLKVRLKNGERLHGLFCCTPSSLSVEFIAHAGFDYVVPDTEHSLVNPADLDHMFVAAGAAAHLEKYAGPR